MKPFDADKITLGNWEGNQILTVMKKPIQIHAIRLGFPEGFEVTSKEGKLKGKPGDYLMIEGTGGKYICDKETFDKTYDIIGRRVK